MRKAKMEFPFKEPILNPRQLDKLADVFIAGGQLSAASMVLPFVIPTLDRTRTSVIILGVIITFTSWIGSVLIVRKLK